MKRVKAGFAGGIVAFVAAFFIISAVHAGEGRVLSDTVLDQIVASRVDLHLEIPEQVEELIARSVDPAVQNATSQTNSGAGLVTIGSAVNSTSIVQVNMLSIN